MNNAFFTKTQDISDDKYLKLLSQEQQSAAPRYNGSYDKKLGELYKQIEDREDFDYDLNADTLYQQYRDQYQSAGAMAQRDTLGQASSLTGGYASSYAQTAAQQQYDGYLQSLNDKIPQLYSAAADRYDQQGQELYKQYSLADSAAQAEQATRRQAYDDLIYLIGSTAYDPGDDELERSGMTRRQANLLRRKYYTDRLLPVPKKLSDAIAADAKEFKAQQAGAGAKALSASAQTQPASAQAQTAGGAAAPAYADAAGLTAGEIARIQAAMGVSADGVWGEQTQSAYDAAKARYAAKRR